MKTHFKASWQNQLKIKNGEKVEPGTVTTICGKQVNLENVSTESWITSFLRGNSCGVDCGICKKIINSGN